MKLLLRLVVGLVLLLVLAAGGLLAYLFLAFPKVGRAPDLTVNATPDAIARGAYLAVHVSSCIDCHSERDWSRFSGPVKPGTYGQGGEVFDAEHANTPGTLYARNITPAAVGSWTDGELLRAIAAGVSRDGAPLFPLMPYPHFGTMAEADVHAIIAYIRTLEPIARAVPARSLTFPMNLITRTLPAEPAFTPRPPDADKVAYGGYLVNAAGCSECHTQIDNRGQPLPGMAFAGGTEFRIPGGFRVHTANITPDADTGIGTWTEQQFVDKFKGFEAPSDRVLTDAEQRQNTVMPWTMYAGMTREDLAAIYAYLRTLKPVVNRVTKFPDQIASTP